MKLPAPQESTLLTKESFCRVLAQARAEEWRELTLTRTSNQWRSHIRGGADADKAFIVVLSGAPLIKEIALCRDLRVLTAAGFGINDAEAETLADLQQLVHLDLSDNNIGFFGVLALTRIASLRTLKLANNRLGTRGTCSLASFTRLETLDISSNGIDGSNIGALRSLEQLRHLNLYGNNLGDDGTRALPAFPRLELLDLGNNQITHAGAEAIAQITTLRTLRLGLNSIGNEGLRKLSTLRVLSDLNLHRNGIDASGAEALIEHPHLSSLYIANNELGPKGGSAIGKLKTLSSLVAGGCQLGAAGVASLRDLSEILSLHLSQNGIGPKNVHFLEGLPRLQKLSLSQNQLADADITAVARFSTLTELLLSSNPLGDGAAEALAPLHSLTNLDFSGTNIHDEGVHHLVSLQSLTQLNLSSTRISLAGIRALSALKKLARLQLNSTNCAGLTLDVLEDFPEITSLSANNAQIGDEGAEAIGKMSQLSHLALGHNSVKARGARALAALENLATLDLSNNSIGDEGAKHLAEMKSITTLQLAGNRIGAEGAEALGALKWLAFLDLGSNHVGPNGAKGLCNIGYLERLNIPNNRLGDEGACWLARIPGLHDVAAAQNGIGDTGAKCLSQADQLGSVYLAHNQIGDDGAVSLANLQKLVSLTLDHNLVGDRGTAALSTLPNLWGIDLSHNRVSDGGLRALLERWSSVGPGARQLNITGNPLTLLPPEVLALRDTSAILAAFTRYELSPKSALNEAKLLVVGREAVGKTSLIRYLVDNRPCSENEPKTPGVHTHEKIDTRTWSPDGAEFRLNVWDFGGQEVFYSTHKFFFTERSVYLLVLEDRREDDKSVYEWLRIIANRGGTSPILIVINKCDNGKQSLQLDERVLISDWPNVVGVVRTSCSEGAFARGTINHLRAKLVKILAEDPRLAHVRDEFPDPWAEVKRQISALAKEKPVLSLHDFLRMCEAQEIKESKEQQLLLDLLHDLGAIFVPRSRNRSALDLTLLNPNWLTAAVYRILTSEIVAQQFGLFSEEQLPAIIGEVDLPPRHYGIILEMIMPDDIGLCLALSHESRRQFLIPELLPASEPHHGEWPPEARRIVFEYDYFPRGLIPRIIVETCRLTTIHRWRTGLVLEVSGCQVRIRGSVARNSLEICVIGPRGRRRGALEVVLQALRHVHALNPETKPEARVPLPDAPNTSVSYQYLLRLEELASPDYEFWAERGGTGKYRVQDLLEGIPREEEATPIIVPSSSRLRADSMPSVGGTGRPVVLLITAVPIERKSVLDLLREEHGQVLVRRDEHSGRYFNRFDWSGRGRTWDVFLGQPTEKGGAAAQALLQDFVRLHKPEIVVMVGMCGGLPEHGAEEGMVILARQVFNYESARIRDGRAHLNPSAYRASPRFIDLANALLAEGAFDSIKIKTTKDYASGDKLVDDLRSEVRAKILELSGDIVGFEMEAPDLLHAIWELERTPPAPEVVIVKGVSDFGDGRQQEDKESRQRLATTNAARIALRLLSDY